VNLVKLGHILPNTCTVKNISSYNSTWAERSSAPSAYIVSSLPHYLPRHSPVITELYSDVFYPAKMQIFSQISQFSLNYIPQFWRELKTCLFPAHSKRQRIRAVYVIERLGY